MKPSLLLIGILLTVGQLRAEYAGWFVKFSMETTAGEAIEGHLYLTSEFDQTSTDRNYLVQRFARADYQSNGKITYYHHRIRYDYQVPEDPSDRTIYSLATRDSIDTASVKAIRVLETIDFGYLSGVFNQLEITDTTWLQSPPVAFHRAEGYLCSWEIFLHEKTAKTDALLTELRELSTQFEQEMREFDEAYENAQGNEREQMEQKKESASETIDERVGRIVKKFQGNRVLVIAFCSC